MALVAAVLRIQYLRIIPIPIMQPDSASYFLPALELILKSQFSLSPDRTPLYPLLIYAALKLTKNFIYLIAFQHVLSLMIAFFAGWLARFHFGASGWRAFFVACFIALLPGQLTFSHHIMTEIPYSFLLMFFVFLFHLCLKYNRAAIWGLLGIILSLLMLMRPVALSVVASLFLACVFFVCWKTYARGIIISAIICSFILVSWCVRNLNQFGFFGLSTFGGVSLFGNTAYLLEVKNVSDPKVRDALNPIYEANRTWLREGNLVRSKKNGPIQVLKDQQLVDPYNRDFTRLAFVAIKSHPIVFLFDQLKDFGEFILLRSAGPQYIISKEFSVVSGFDSYWNTIKDLPEAKPYISIQRNEIDAYYDRLQQFSLFPFDQDGWLAVVLGPIKSSLYLIPCLSLVAGLLMLRDPSKRPMAFLILLLIVTHIVLTNLGADKTPRHAIPLEPLYIIILFSYTRRLCST